MVMALHPDPHRYGLAATSPWWSGATYMFLHASFIHLGMNLWVLHQLLRHVSWKGLAAAFATGALIPGFCLTAAPTVGMSGALFAAIGMMWYKFRDFRRSQAYFCALIALGFAAWALGAPVNPFVHIWCYAIGFIIGILTKPSWKVGDNCLKKTRGVAAKGAGCSTR